MTLQDKPLAKVNYFSYNQDKEVLVAYRLYNGNMQVHNTFRISISDIDEVIKVLQGVKHASDS